MEDTSTVDIDISTLKDHFTEEELQSVIPSDPEPTPEPIADTTPEPESEPEPTPEPEPEPTAPDSDKVSKHVPYDRFKEVNDKNKALAAEIAALRAQQQPTQQTAPQQPPQHKEKTIREVAKERVIAKHGEFNFFDEEHASELAENIADIKFERKMNELAIQQRDSQYQNFVNEYLNRPDAQELKEFAAQKYANMSRAEQIGYSFAEQRQDVSILKPLYESVLKEFEAQKNPVVASVPITSPLDKAAGLPKAQNLSGSKTSAMSWSQVEDLIRKGKVDQIPQDMIKQIDPRLLE